MAQEIDASKQETFKKAADTEQKFTVAALRASCVKTFGCTSSTFDGAFFGKEGKEYTISEANKIINDWLGKEAK